MEDLKIVTDPPAHDRRWEEVGETPGEGHIGNVGQMFTLPWECDIVSPRRHMSFAYDDGNPANNGRRTRRIHRTITITDESASSLCSSCSSYCQCHFRGAGFNTSAYIVLLVAILFAIAAVCLFVYAQVSSLSKTNSTLIASHNIGDRSATHSNLGGDQTTTDYDTGQQSLALPISTRITNATETGCMEIPMMQCRPHLSYNTTCYPNRFNLGRTRSEGVRMFRAHSTHFTTSCHADAERFLCRLFFPPASAAGPAINPEVSPVSSPLPCRSVCQDIGTRCSGDPDMNDLSPKFCNFLPESANDDICFRNSSLKTFEVPAACQSAPCQNGGECLDINGRAVCKCSSGFYGIYCDQTFKNPCSPNPCINNMACQPLLTPFGFSSFTCDQIQNGPPTTASQIETHPIPSECESVLPYAETPGMMIGTNKPFYSPWPLLESYTVCSPRAAKVVYCTMAYPNPSLHLLISPCRVVCETAKRDCEFTYEVLGLPPVNCAIFDYVKRTTCLGLA